MLEFQFCLYISLIHTIQKLLVHSTQVWIEREYHTHAFEHSTLTMEAADNVFVVSQTRWFHARYQTHSLSMVCA